MEGEGMLRLWRMSSRPLHPDAAAKWLRHAHSGFAGPSAPAPAAVPSSSQMVAAAASGAARLISAPHQPRTSKWGAFGQPSTGGSVQAAPSWAAPALPPALPASWPRAGVGGLQPESSSSWGSRLRGGDSAHGGGAWGATLPAAPQAPAIPADFQQQVQPAWKPQLSVNRKDDEAGFDALELEGADELSPVRAASNSPPVPPVGQQQQQQQQGVAGELGGRPTVYPPDIHAFRQQPSSVSICKSGPSMRVQQLVSSTNLPATHQPPQPQQQQHQEHCHHRTPYHEQKYPPSAQQHPPPQQVLPQAAEQSTVELSSASGIRCGGGSSGRAGAAALLPPQELDSWQAAPSAAEHMLCIQQQGLHAASRDVVTQAWHEQRFAGMPCAGGVPPPSGQQAAAPPPQQRQSLGVQLKQRLQQQRQQQLQAHHEEQQPFPGSMETAHAQALVPLGPQHSSLVAQPPSAPPAARAPPRAKPQPAAAAPASAAPLKGAQRQAVLLSAGKFAVPLPEPPVSAWQQQGPAALHVLNQDPKQPRGQQPQQQPRRKSSTAAAAGGSSGGAGGGSKEQKQPQQQQPQAKKSQGRAKAGQPSAAPAAAADADGGGSDFEDLAAEKQQPPAKRQRRKAAAAGAANAGRSGAAAAAGGEQAPAREVLEVGPWLGVVDVCTPLGFSRFAGDMQKAPSCSIGLLLVDSTGSQFFSTLEPLTKEQQQRIKAAAAAAAGKGGRKGRASGKGEAAAGAASGAGAAAGGAAGAASGAAAASATSTSTAGSSAAGNGGTRAVGLCILPLRVDQQTGSATPSATLYFAPLAAGVWGGQEVSDAAAEQGRDVARQLLGGGQGGAVVAFNMQGVLRVLSDAGVAVPPPHRLALVDPRLLAWLLEPQLLQGGDKELQDYSLAELADRHLGGMPAGAAAAPANGSGGAGGSAATAAAASPLQRIRRALEAAVALGEHLHVHLTQAQLPPETMQREMQIAGLLAQMECAGLGFDPWLLRQAGQTARRHMQRLEEECAGIVGRTFNLGSPQQLADVLYNELKLPPPTARGRSAAKTHLPTDENALQSLRQLSPLPSLVLEYRALQNFASKWVEAEWCRAAAGGYGSAEEYAKLHPCSGGWPRVRCSWHQTSTATGRLSSSAPNLQAVTKYELEAAGAEGLINIRDAFVAPAGCVLLSADYSQVELRVLAHLSGDTALVELLQRAGPAGDAFNLIASNWLGSGDVASVSKEDREKAKRVTYGIIYGLTAYGLAQGSGALGISVQAAQELINSFLSHFKGVAAFVESTKAAARSEGGVSTLAGRRRPIKGLNSTDKRVRAEAERKAVNTTIQGSAADLMKRAMVDWCRWHEAAGSPPVRIVAQLHDELMVEVDGTQVDIAWVAQELRRVMVGVAQLRVPLAVKVKSGQRWGSMMAVE